MQALTILATQACEFSMTELNGKQLKPNPQPQHHHSVVPFRRKNNHQPMLTYKGYTGHLEVDTEAGILFGRVLDVKDVITFQGETVEAAQQAFKDSIDDYLEFCEELGESPDKPFSGKFHFRTTPENHRKITIAATQAGQSINSWIEEVTREAADKAISS